MNTQTLTITAARAMLDSKEISAVELTQAYLDTIAQKDGEIHAYLEVFDDALEQAKAADARIAVGETQPLLGVPLAIKDNILIKGKIASSASKILENYRAAYDATVITKLKDQGSIFLGRTNMDEFAMGSSTENSAFGPTKNPHDTTRVPGGTSGGSAAAVVAGMACAALGSDTGGSIRQPASLCGVVGIKPTYGAVSRYGLMAAVSSFDQIGALARSVDDAQLVFEHIRGHDVHDSTTLSHATVPEKKPKVIGVPRAFMAQGVDPDVLAAIDAALDTLKAHGYVIRDVDMPALAHSLAAYYIINPAEISSNLARFDGIRYGASVRTGSHAEVMSRSRAAGFGPETRRRILVGTFVLSAGYFDAYYGKAMTARQMIRDDFTRVFADVDIIVTPTSPVPAFKIGEKSADPLSLYAADIFTVPINIAGVPAMSVPCGTVDRDGKKLPVGIQFIAPHRYESSLFAVGKDLGT